MLVIDTASNLLDLELVRSLLGLWTEEVQELVDVLAVAGLVQVVGVSDLVLARDLGLVVVGAVEGTNAVWSGES